MLFITFLVAVTLRILAVISLSANIGTTKTPAHNPIKGNADKKPF